MMRLTRTAAEPAITPESVMGSESILSSSATNVEIDPTNLSDASKNLLLLNLLFTHVNVNHFRPGEEYFVTLQDGASVSVKITKHIFRKLYDNKPYFEVVAAWRDPKSIFNVDAPDCFAYDLAGALLFDKNQLFSFKPLNNTSAFTIPGVLNPLDKADAAKQALLSEVLNACASLINGPMFFNQGANRIELQDAHQRTFIIHLHAKNALAYWKRKRDGAPMFEVVGKMFARGSTMAAHESLGTFGRNSSGKFALVDVRHPRIVKKFIEGSHHDPHRLLDTGYKVSNETGMHEKQPMYVDRDFSGQPQKYSVQRRLPGEDFFITLLTHTFTMDQRLTIARNFILALINFHKRGFIHGDLQPANIRFIPETLEVILFDTSFSRSIEEEKNNVMCGTPGYIAPEVWRGKGITRKSDIYAAGRVLMEIFGAPPPEYKDSDASAKFELESYTPSFQNLLRGFVVNKTEAVDIPALIQCIIKKNPNERFSLGYVLSQLDLLIAERQSYRDKVLGCATDLRGRLVDLAATKGLSLDKLVNIKQQILQELDPIADNSADLREFMTIAKLNLFAGCQSKVQVSVLLDNLISSYQSHVQKLINLNMQLQRNVLWLSTFPLMDQRLAAFGVTMGKLLSEIYRLQQTKPATYYVSLDNFIHFIQEKLPKEISSLEQAVVMLGEEAKQYYQQIVYQRQLALAIKSPSAEQVAVKPVRSANGMAPSWLKSSSTGHVMTPVQRVHSSCSLGSGSGSPGERRRLVS